jgi:hypothetical protein
MLVVPTAVGLLVCEQAVIEENTRNITLVNCVSRVRCAAFPSSPKRLVVYAVLTDGRGNATMRLNVARLDTLEDVYETSWPMRFRDPLRDIRLILRLPPIEFPVPERYQFCLTADGTLVAQTVLQLDEEE